MSIILRGMVVCPCVRHGRARPGIHAFLVAKRGWPGTRPGKTLMGLAAELSSSRDSIRSPELRRAPFASRCEVELDLQAVRVEQKSW